MNTNTHAPCQNAAALTLAALFVIAMTSNVPAQNPAITITNPTPDVPNTFGQRVATVGDSLLVADPSDAMVGAVYLFNSNGVLMRTFTNPAPANGHFFGFSLAAFGNDKVLIGAPLPSPPPAGHPGAAYLYHTNGTLIRTFLRPTTESGARFGVSVAALGNDRVLIGADGDDHAGTDSGAAYLFSTDGTLLATFTNPAPQNFESLGAALTVVGPDRVLIGAPHTPGSAFLFDTNGVMLAKFDNPIPASGGTFGRTVAAVGPDVVAIGAPGANIMAPGGGVVYLFRTNGVLSGPALENPDVSLDDNFGLSLATVGADKILVGSYHQAAGQNTGAAYLFSTNGMMLMRIPNLSTNADYFGFGLAAVSADRVLIGAWGTAPAGTAYVFDLLPSMNISRTDPDTIRVSWPSPWNDWTVQQNTNLVTGAWTPALESMADDGMNKFIIVTPPAGNRFYRLAKP